VRRLRSIRQLRRLPIFMGLPKEIITGLLIITVLATATGVVSSSSPHHPRRAAAAPPAGGGGAFVPATVPPTTPTSTVPPTTATTPPTTTSPAPPPTTPRVVPRATPSTSPPPPPAHTVVTSAALGVYTGAANPAGAASFAAATGAHVTVVEDYLPGNGSWADIDGAGGSLDWMFDAWKGRGYQLVLGVPMFAGSDSPPDTLAAGAAGDYNSDFATLAQTLVSAGQGNAILRLGQEPTGNWNAWRITDVADAENYAEFYRQIVSSMRTVPGQAFKFIWEAANPQYGSYPGAYTADEAYPGDAYVDYVGADTYDQSWSGGCGLGFNNTTTAAQSQCSWNGTLLPALTTVAAYAAAHGKPVVFPEWGLAIRADGHGMGDDPAFIDLMAAWMASHDVAFDIYFNFDVPGQVDSTITDGHFPASLVAFRSLFG
jgi:hypothetical protein